MWKEKGSSEGVVKRFEPRQREILIQMMGETT